MAKFKTRARTIDMLGRQQIAGIPTAISEIFKNAHDAYATEVKADFIRYQDNLFIIRDNGIGMTKDEFLNRWLAVGTDSKVQGGSSTMPYKPKNMDSRPMLGEKGIGRLAIASIGPQVLILTRAKRGKDLFDTVVCFINWRIFECPGINLDEIEIPVDSYLKGDLPNSEDIELYKEIFRDNLKHLGKKVPQHLKLEILEDLDRFNIDPRQIDQILKANDRIDGGGKKDRELTLTDNKGGTHFFVLPADEHLKTEIDSSDNITDKISRLKRTLIGFTNTMKISESKPESSNVQNENNEKKNIIETAFIDHKISDDRVNLITENEFFTLEDFDYTDHTFEGEFNNEGEFNGKIQIYHEKSVEYHLENSISNKKTKCGPFKIKFGYVQGVENESRLIKKDWTYINGKLATYGGLYIYKNGIRVLPYGNQEFDYLELEKRRSLRASEYFFSYRRLFGYIELETSNLKEKAGREGFIEDAAYKEFKSLIINLLINLANTFFKAKGDYSDTFLVRKARASEQRKANKQRQQETKNKRQELENLLDDFFTLINEEEPQEEVDLYIKNLSDKVNQKYINSYLDNEQSVELLDLSREAHNEIDKIEKKLKIVDPKIGLTGKLGRSWINYVTEFQKLKNEVFEPAKRKIDELTRAIGENSINSQLLAEKVLDEYKTKISSDELSLRVSQEEVFTKINFNDLREQFEQILWDFKKEASILRDKLKNEIQGKDNFTIGLKLKSYQNKLNEVFEKYRHKQEIFKDNLNELVKIASDKSLSKLSQSELLASFEEQNAALEEDYAEAVEMAQIGMAISVINHEFSNVVRDIRQNLRRLGEWAAGNKDLGKLYRDLRRGFDHLDEYVKLFSPIQRRFNREEIDIEGSEIYMYLKDVFSDILEKEDIGLEKTNEFEKAIIHSYPSSIYPVFINLVDNAIYWLKDHRKPRVIKLDAEENGILTVSDNGPGIQIKDKKSIFEAGVTAKPGGRGLGLKISQDALKRINYNLVLAETKRGEGTIFKIIPDIQE